MEQQMKPKPDSILCYIDGNRAFFVDVPLSKVWGDDWDDAPYEHNAGQPSNTEAFDVYFDGPYETPADIAGGNSRYSVERINRGDIAWLSPSRWESGDIRPIHAGTSYETFCELMKLAGGTVYEPRDVAMFPLVSPEERGEVPLFVEAS